MELAFKYQFRAKFWFKLLDLANKFNFKASLANQSLIYYTYILFYNRPQTGLSPQQPQKSLLRNEKKWSLVRKTKMQNLFEKKKKRKEKI